MILSDIRTADQLEQFLHTKNLNWEDCQLPDKEFFSKVFPLRIPFFYANLIDWKNPNDPLRLMVMPDPKEKDFQKYELDDPIGDTAHETIPGLIHRYPDRCLFLFTTYCAIHCRFCFRRDVIGKPRLIEILNAVDYVKNNKNIREIIFTGGDPGIFPDRFLTNIFNKLRNISQLKIVRFHTRALVVDPTMIPDKWIKSFDKLPQQKIIVLHINHLREITPELAQLVQKLINNNFRVFSQTVLLKKVNATTQDLRRLFLGLVDIGVTPYYLHHLDYAQGTHYFRISVEEGKKIYAELRGKIAGYTIPEYVIDLPGGDGKYPVMWMKKLSDKKYEAKSWDGKTIIYNDPI